MLRGAKLKFDQRSQTSITRLLAFKELVMLTTSYPRLRHFFLVPGLAKYKGKEDLVIDIWKRNANCENHEWEFFNKLAAACILEEHVTEIVEKTPPEELANTSQMDGGPICALLRALSIG
jgi:hypothetical protein